ncbi:MAG: sigma-70 family RNA polymerase sigma factor [Bacteroidaceae bacterium]|nr:sigma-70 family RNA polymerase sigma factor [Bacteroidaceae bacterium]
MTKEEYTQAIPLIRKEMLRIATDMLGKNGGAEDAVQDALLKLSLDYKKIEVTALRIYSRIVLINVCKDNLKRKKRHKTCSIEEIDVLSLIDDTESLKMLEEQCSGLVRIIQKIPSRQKMLIELVYFKKLDVKTISTITGISVANIHKNISRTRIRLLRILSSLGLLAIVIAFSFDFVNNRLEKSATPVETPVAEAEKPVARRQEAETAADTSRSEGAKSAIRLLPTTPNNAEVAKSENADRPISPKSAYSSISVCFDLDEEDVKLIATVSYEKTEEGQYITHSCDYKVVNDSGRKMFFVPDEEVKTYVDSPVLNVDINGTLVCVDADGEKTDRYVSVKRCVFDNDEL